MIAFMLAVIVTDRLYSELPSLRQPLAAVHAENSAGRGLSATPHAARMLGAEATANGCRWAIPARPAPIFYGACGVEGCKDCRPLFDADNEPIPGTDTEGVLPVPFA